MSNIPVSEAVIARPKKVSAPIYRAPIGSTLPESAVAVLDNAFKSIGSISEDGLSESIERESETIKRWGGDVILVTQTGKTDTFKFTLVDHLNVERQKVTYGDDNVTGDISTGLKIESKNDELEAHAYVIDEILTGNVLQRTVIPKANVTEVGEVKHDDSSALSQEVTLTAIADDNGLTFTRYIVKSA